MFTVYYFDQRDVFYESPFKDLIMTQHSIRNLDSDKYNAIRNKAVDLTDVNASEQELNGYRYSLFNIIWNQLSTPSIRDSMHWLRFRDRRNSNVVFWRALTKWKLCRDAFAFETGRSNILVSLTNCSVEHCCNTYHNADIVSINDLPEDKFNLHLVSQQCEKELTILRVIGIPDPHSGIMLGVHVVSVEDTGALEKTLGRGNAKSPGRWLYTKVGPRVHIDKYFTHLVPISIDAKAVNTAYQNLVQAELFDYCKGKGLNPHLVQFYRDNNFRRGEAQHKDYLLAWKRISTNAQRFLCTYGEWLTANSVHALPLEGLHGELRISTHTIKYVVIFSISYYEWMGEDPTSQQYRESNHSGQFIPQSREQVLQHFRKCCRLNFSLPTADKLGTLNVKNSFVFLCIALNLVTNRFCVDTEGIFRTRFMSELPQFLCCDNDNCHFGPLEGSPLKPYMALMLQSMHDSLLPFQILDKGVYNCMYKTMIEPSITIGQGDQEYKAGVWKITAVMYQYLFCELMGYSHYTRYMHSLVNGGEYWLRMARSIHGTQRGLHGGDQFEQLNDHAKALVKRASMNFATHKSMRQVMRAEHQAKYGVREKELRTNMKTRQKKNRERQRRKDFQHLAASDRHRQGFIKRDADLTTDFPTPIRQTQQLWLWPTLNGNLDGLEPDAEVCDIQSF